MVNTELIKNLLTRLKEDAEKGCELKSSDFSGKDTLNVDAAHDAILYCQPHKHNDDTIFDDEHYTDDSSKQNGNYPGTSRHKSECVSKLEENVCYIRDSFSGVALKGYNNYLDSAGTPKIQEWHKYHFGIPITTGGEIGTGLTKNKDLFEKIKDYSTYLNFDKFIHKEYELKSGGDMVFNDCILGLNFTWQAVLYYGYCQFLNNAKSCNYEISKIVNAKKIIESLRQIHFVDLEDSVPKWIIGHAKDRSDTIFDAFNVFDDSSEEGDNEWNSMKKTELVTTDGPYYFITSQSFVHSQISKILPNDYKPDDNKGFEARNEGDEDSAGKGEVEMEQGMKKLLEIIVDKSAKIMLWQFLKFQGDSSHLVFYSIIDVPKKNISIKVLTGERPLVKRAQLEGKTIVVKKFNVFTKKWVEAGSSEGTYIEFVADTEAQAKILLAKAISLKQSEYYTSWTDPYKKMLDDEIKNVNNNSKSTKGLIEKIYMFGRHVIKEKIEEYMKNDNGFKKDAEKFFKLMRAAGKGNKLKYLRDAGGKQFDFGKDVDVVFSKLGFLADNYDTLEEEDKDLWSIKDMMNGIQVGRRGAVNWNMHLQYIVNSFDSHEKGDAGLDVNYRVVVQKKDTNLEIDIKALTIFVCMNYYVTNDRSTFSSSSDSYQKVFFFAKILKFFIEHKDANVELSYTGGGPQVGGVQDWLQRRMNLRNELIKIYNTNTETSDLYKSVLQCYITIAEEIEKVDYSSEFRTGHKYKNFNKKTGTMTAVTLKELIDDENFKKWEKEAEAIIGGPPDAVPRFGASGGKFTYNRAQYEKALFKKFLDTVPHNIELADLHKFHAQEPKKEEQMEDLIPDYNANYPYTIWWLYSYIHKGAAYEDFTDLFNSKINTVKKYYFENEEKFMKWKENIKIFAKFASINKSMIRFKYEYFLENDKFKKYLSITGNKSFTELEIRHLIISIIKYSGNRVLEDLEIVYRIQDSLDEVMVEKSLTFDEVLKDDYDKALKNGNVVDLTGDEPTVLKPSAKSVRIMKNEDFYGTLNDCINKSSLSDEYKTLVEGFIGNIQTKSMI